MSMPPRSKPKRASDIFVNRDTPLKVFEDAALNIPKEHAIIRVFYGIGGQGKTALSQKLMRTGKDDSSYSDHHFALVDLHGRHKDDAALFMIWVRNALAKTGIYCPCFDITLALLWESSRAEQHLPKLPHSFLAKTKDAFDFLTPDMAKSGNELATDLLNPDTVKAGVEVVAETIGSIPLLGATLRRLGGWAFDKSKTKYLEATREHLQELYYQGQLKKPYQLADLLPWMLAQDLNYYTSHNPNKRLVLLVDEYENILEGAGTGKRRQDPPIDTYLRKFVEETNALLLVMFSRERMHHWETLTWWGEAIIDNQHQLAGLDSKDANSWLEQVPIEDTEIRQAILQSAGIISEQGDLVIYPLLLDLLVEHWKEQIKQDTVEIDRTLFLLSDSTFEGRLQSILIRLLRDYGQEIESTLEYLSVANSFDKQAFCHVIKTMGTGLAPDKFEQITSLSFISQAEDGFYVIEKKYQKQ